MASAFANIFVGDTTCDVAVEPGLAAPSREVRMPVTMKFNPGFQTDEEAIANFVVRGDELERLVGIFGATGSGRALVVAPRGAGKTTLCRRVLAETRNEGRLAQAWHAVFLGEENYTVTTPGEFFLECLFHLKDQDQREDLSAWYDEVSSSRSEDELFERSLEVLKRYSLQLGRRLLVIVENFHTILRDQVGTKSETLIRALSDASTFGVLATSVARAKGDKLFNQLAGFESIALSPLSLPECHMLWRSLTGQEVSREKIRPLQILTGGSPRLLHILAEFMRTPSLKDLMDNLNVLIDQNTEYFKSQLDNLPSVERKVFAALLDLWDPSSAKQVAEAARVDTNIASAMLSRLSDRGSVVKEPGQGRQSIYFASERLFNIYYLMRRRSHPSNRVRALVAFMTEYYDRDELVSTTAILVREACLVEPGRRADYHSAFDAIISRASEGVRRTILEQTPQEFIQSFREAQRAQRGDPRQAGPDEQRDMALADAIEKIEHAADGGDLERAETLLRDLIAEHAEVTELWMRLALLEYRRGKLDEAIDAARNAKRLDDADPWAQAMLGMLLLRVGEEEEGVATLKVALTLDPNQLMAMIELAGHYAEQDEVEQALDMYAKALAAESLPDIALAQYGQLLMDADREAEAEQLLSDNALADADSIFSRRVLATYLYEEEREDEATAMLRAAAERHGNWEAWADLGVFLHARTGDAASARDALERAMSLGATEPVLYRALAEAMLASGGDAGGVRVLAQQLTDKFPDTASAWTAAGQIYRKLNDTVLAESSWRASVKLGSNFARLQLAKLLTETNIEEAEAIYREAAENAGDHCRPLKELAEFLVHKGEDVEAGDVLATAIQKHADCGCSLILQGQVCTRRKDFEAARDSFEQALSRRPDSISALTGLAAVVERDRAHDLIRTAIEEDPEDPRLLFARAQLGIGTLEEQILDAEKALSISSKYTEARILLAKLQARAGNSESALEHLQHALSEIPLKRELISTFVSSAMVVAGLVGSEKVSAIIDESEARLTLEPLNVALQISRGENPLVAKEVFEVAKDIVSRFT